MELILIFKIFSLNILIHLLLVKHLYRTVAYRIKAVYTFNGFGIPFKFKTGFYSCTKNKKYVIYQLYYVLTHQAVT